jgi:hypothetical protein
MGQHWDCDGFSELRIDMQSFRNLGEPGRKAIRTETKKEGEKNDIDRGHDVPPATPKGSACSLLRPHFGFGLGF